MPQPTLREPKYTFNVNLGELDTVSTSLGKEIASFDSTIGNFVANQTQMDKNWVSSKASGIRGAEANANVEILNGGKSSVVAFKEAIDKAIEDYEPMRKKIDDALNKMEE